TRWQLMRLRWEFYMELLPVIRHLFKQGASAISDSDDAFAQVEKSHIDYNDAALSAARRVDRMPQPIRWIMRKLLKPLAMASEANSATAKEKAQFDPNSLRGRLTYDPVSI